jgi:hypothetical protein
LIASVGTPGGRGNRVMDVVISMHEPGRAAIHFIEWAGSLLG